MSGNVTRASGKVWTRTEIEDFLRTEDLEYQRIELPYGLATPGSDRTATADRIFGESVAGKSVLDVGSFLGFFCLEALARGARRAVGWEVDPHRARQARAIAEIRGLPVELHQRDIEGETPDEQFDIVICLNVLHHLNDPLAGLDKLVRLTRERLVLEVPSVGGADCENLGLWPGAGGLLSRFPVIVVGKGRTTYPHTQRKFYFTQAAIQNLLMFQHYQFARTKVFASDKDRFLMVADRRRIGHVVVVAGPTFAATSAVARRLRATDAPEITAHLAGLSPGDWPVADSTTIRSLTTPSQPGLIFAYDILQPWLLAARTHVRDESLGVLDDVDEISVVTVWTPPHELAARANRGRSTTTPRRLPLRGMRQAAGRLPGVKRLARWLRPQPSGHRGKVAELYRNSQRVRQAYDEWLAFCDLHLGSRVRRHLVVMDDGTNAVHRRDDWDKISST